MSAARLGTLAEPRFTGLNAFLAENTASSGMLILEYVAQAAVADIRRFATPAALGSAVLRQAYDLTISMLNDDFADRPLDDDLAVAANLLDDLALLLPAAGTAG